jgi:hypothetical protein
MDPRQEKRLEREGWVKLTPAQQEQVAQGFDLRVALALVGSDCYEWLCDYRGRYEFVRRVA